MPEGTRVAGFKEIRYFNALAFMPRQLEIMQSYSPKVRILFLTRDHAQVANSSWGRGHDKDTLLPKLARADQAFHDTAASHDACFALDCSVLAQGAAGLGPCSTSSSRGPTPSSWRKSSARS